MHPISIFQQSWTERETTATLISLDRPGLFGTDHVVCDKTKPINFLKLSSATEDHKIKAKQDLFDYQ